MLSKLFAKSPAESIPQQLYGKLVAQARDPKWYGKYGVRDTVMGRFDMLSLHVYLLARRLRKEDSQVAQSLSQDVFDLFVADIDRALRELGIGDTTVPKRKKAMVRSFYGQIEDFDQPLEHKDVSLLAERMNARFFEGGSLTQAMQLADCVFSLTALLEETAFDAVLAGDIPMPNGAGES